MFIRNPRSSVSSSSSITTQPSIGRGSRQAARQHSIEALERRTLLSGAPAEQLFTLPSSEVNVRFASAVDSGGKLFLIGQRGDDTKSLYASDGAGSAAKLLTTYVSGGPQFGISCLTAFNGKVYFFANSLSDGEPADGLFVTDGTPQGTLPVALIRTGTSNVLPTATYVADGRLYFEWTDPTAGGLWSSDGTAAGTAPVPAGTSVDLPPQPANAGPVSTSNVFEALGRRFALQRTTSGLTLASATGDAAFGPPVRYLATNTLDLYFGAVLLGVHDGRLAVYGYDAGGSPSVFTLDPDAVGGSITGGAYVDENNDGRREGFERTLRGTAYVDANGNGIFDSREYGVAVTDFAGFTLDGLPAGSYAVRYTPSGPDAGTPVARPSGGGRTVVVAAGQATGGTDFAAAGTSTLVWGTVFNDVDADGVRDPGEYAVPYPQRVYIDLNGNGLLEPGTEPNTTSSYDGTYGFAVQAGGTYFVRRAGMAGWRPTTPPGGGPVEVTVATGQAAEAAAIGVTSDPGVGSIAGRAWGDTNADGVRQAGEPTIAGVAVYLIDETGATAATATTDAAGAYAFAKLTPGSPYRVRFESPFNRSLTAPDRGADDAADSDADLQTGVAGLVWVNAGQTASGVDAGFIPRTVVSGKVYRDVNENGRADATDPGVPGVPVFLDADGDGLPGPGETPVVSSVGGQFFLNASPGTARLGLVAPAGFVVAGPAAGRTGTVTLGGTAFVSGAVAAARPAGHVGPVGTEFPVNQTTAGYQLAVAVAADAAGNVVAAWYDRDSGQAVARRFDAAGTPQGGEFAVSTQATGGGGPQVAQLAGGGGFVVAWIGTGGTAYVRRFAADGSPLGLPFAPSPEPGGQNGVRLAADPTGGFAVAWGRSTVVQPDRLLARRYDAAGNPTGDAFQLNQVNAVVGSSIYIGDITIDGAGRLIAVYSSPEDGSSLGVYARRFAADGSPDGPAVLVNQTTLAAQVARRVVAAADGRILVLWLSDTHLFVRMCGPDLKPLGGEVLIDSYNRQHRDAITAGLAAGTDGNFLVAWTSVVDGVNAEVFGQLLNPDGVPDGREFRLDTSSQYGQTDPALAPGPGGTYLAAWTSSGQDGSGDGLYAQRLETFAARSTIAGVAWADDDGDGVRAAGEVGAPNVPVELYTAAGAIVATTKTGPDGTYRFPELRPGAGYRVRFIPPANYYFLSPPDQGADDAADSDADQNTGYAPAFMAPAAGGVVTGVDVGTNLGFRAKLQAAAVNGGVAQRSTVSGLTLTFDRAVVLDAGTFALAGRGGVGAGVTVTAANPAGDGRTWVLSFAGPGVVNGSVPDGVYDLTVVGSKVHAGYAAGPAMAADAVVTFHRLFGDQDGNGTVNNADYVRFRNAFGSAAGGPAYNALFDYDGNGVINNADYVQFRNRFGATLGVG